MMKPHEKLLHIGKTEVERFSLGEDAFYKVDKRFFIKKGGQAAWRELSAGERPEIPIEMFAGQERKTLMAYDVFQQRRDGGIGCNHLFFRAEAGTVTAIMGPSGAGKTTLLKLLSGYEYSRSNQGHILINESEVPRFDVHRDRAILGSIIGYVPQDDTLIPQLTVQASLDYCFRLRYAGVERALRKFIIADACVKAGFDKHDLQPVLNRPIKNLSGGQRKRVNIAHELILAPQILFLDEPTSGLSSYDADEVINSLHTLCAETKITIILTLHQPSLNSFKRLDKLVIVNKGGNLAYFGDAREAAPYFHEKTGYPHSPDQNPSEFILEALEQWNKQAAPEAITASYQETPQFFMFEVTDAVLTRLEQQHAINQEVRQQLRTLTTSHQDWYWRDQFQAGLKQTLQDLYTEEAERAILASVVAAGRFPDVQEIACEKPTDLPQRRASSWHQFGVLLQRNLAVARTDTKNRMFQIIQPIVIGLLMLGAFAWYTQDYYGEDVLSKIGYRFTEKFGKQTIVVEKELPQAKMWAYQHTTLIGEGSANRRAAVFFLLIASCLWFGIINACREIVDERPVLKREAKSTLRMSSYVAAKIVSLGWVCGKQTAWLLAVVALPNLLLSATLPDHLNDGVRATELLTNLTTARQWIGIFVMLWLTSILASWTGLFISALAPTQRFALTAVPLLIIPQLLLGGLIRPIKDIDNSRSFLLTPSVLSRLQQEGVSAELVEKLQGLQHHRFTKEHDLWFAVEMATGKKPSPQLQKALLQHAARMRLGNVFNIPLRIHDLVLQKWSFQMVLMFDALSGVKVLHKIVDVNRYDQYRYLQFEQIELLAMFFDLKIDAADVPAILARLLARIVMFHGILLLMPTYAWLKYTLRA